MKIMIIDDLCERSDQLTSYDFYVLVRTNRHIVECVVDYYELQGKSRNSPEAAMYVKSNP